MNKIFTYYLQEMKPYKWWYVLLLQTIITAPFYYIIYNYSIKLLIDVLTENESFSIVNFYLPIALYLFSEVYVNIVWRASNIAALNCLPQTLNSIFLKTYSYVQNHSYKFFTEVLGGSVVSKIEGIKNGFETLLAIIHYRLGGTAMTAVFCIAGISFVSIKLGIFILLWTVVFVYIMLKLGKKMEYLSALESEEKHKVKGMVADAITNISTIFAFGTTKREFFELKNHINTNLLPKQREIWKFEVFFQTTGAFLYVILLTIAIIGVIYLRYTGAISIGDVYFVLALTWNFMDSAWRATQEIEQLLKTIGDVKSSFSIIETQNEQDLFEEKEIEIKNGEIEFKNIVFKYNKNIVFNKLNLKINSGQKIGLVGLSGAGKSTIVSLLLRYIEPNFGGVYVSGKDISKFSKSSLRRQISVIPQDIILFNRTLLENIKYAKPEATMEEVEEACKKAHIHTFIKNLEQGYHTLVGERGVKLSGGQRQRVGIARAILKNAKILILDEATSSLDSESEAYIQNSINNLLENNITVIAIAHRLATLKHMDKILVLEKGKITEEGTHVSLLANSQSLYKKLWETQKI